VAQARLQALGNVGAGGDGNGRRQPAGGVVREGRPGEDRRFEAGAVSSKTSVTSLPLVRSNPLAQITSGMPAGACRLTSNRLARRCWAGTTTRSAWAPAVAAANVARAVHGRQRNAGQEGRVLSAYERSPRRLRVRAPKTDTPTGSGRDQGQGRAPGAGADHANPLIGPCYVGFVFHLGLPSPGYDAVWRIERSVEYSGINTILNWE